MTSSSTQKLCINADSFLFACIEAYDARRLANGGFNSHTRFEPFLFGTWKQPAERTLENLVSDLRDIAQHHWNVLPQYRRSENIDLETISFFSQGAATLVADVGTLFKAYTGLELPTLPSTPLNAAIDELTVLTALIGRYATYLETLTDETPPFSPWSDETDSEEEKQQLCNEVWVLVEEILAENFGDYATILQAFTRWKFAPKVIKEAIDWRVRPPVGEEFIRWLKIQDPDFFRRLREQRSGGRGSDRGGDRGPRRGGEGRPPRDGDRGGEVQGEPAVRPMEEPTESEEGVVKPLVVAPLKAAVEEIAPRTDKTPAEGLTLCRPEESRRPREEGGEFRRPRPEGERRPRREEGESPRRRDSFGDRPRRPREDGEGGPRSSEAQLEIALNDARDAVKSLRANPKLDEVGLSPVNSFLRRQQHTVIIEAGFETESKGEGRERCVFVKRKDN